MCGCFHGLDVSEGGILAQHLHVDHADQELSENLGSTLLLRELLLESLYLRKDDSVLLLLRLGLPNGLDQLEELGGRTLHRQHHRSTVNN